LSALLEVLAAAITDVEATGVACALVGGIAVGVRAYERTTRDVDLVVACTDDAAVESLVRELRRRGYGLAQVLEHVSTGRISTVRMTSNRSPRTLVDLLVATTGIEAEIVRSAERMEVAAGVACPVARRGHLVAMKVLSSGAQRPRDAQDLIELLRGISVEELALARAAARSIDAAGLHPKRSIAKDLEGVVSEVEGHDA
jgi:hypothetical protein